MHSQKGFIIPLIIIAIGLAVLGTAGYFVYRQYTSPQEPVACTQDAKQCPNGTYVGRIGPDCEFAECPESEDQTESWQTYTNTEYGFEFKYPTNLKVTADVNPANFLNVYLGYANTQYLGDISMQAFKNDENETAAQYFLREKNNALQGFASKCSTCANMDVDAEVFDCLESDSSKIDISGENGFFCKNMPQKATYAGPIYVFYGGYIYRFWDYRSSNPSYEIYQQVLSTFKFINQ